MKKFTFTLVATVFCCILGAALFVSCNTNNPDAADDYQRGLYSDVVPDDGSNSGSKYGITDEDYAACAKALNVEAAALKAVVKVETGGRGGFLPNGKPVILFQGHIFWQQLRTRGINPENYAKGNEDILYPKFDKTKYVGGVGEWDRLDRAVAINEDAALSSASWGMLQTMGYLYKKCGCNTVAEFVGRMKTSELEQLTVFADYLKSSASMLDALRKKDWTTFAKLYYGPSYAQDRYVEKIVKAYSSYQNQ